MHVKRDLLMYQATTHMRISHAMGCGKRRQRSRHTLDAPEEDAYFPAGQLEHEPAPAITEARPSVVRISHGTHSSGHRHYQHRVCVCVCVRVRVFVCVCDEIAAGAASVHASLL